MVLMLGSYFDKSSIFLEIGLIFSENLSNVLKSPKMDENHLETSTKLIRPGGL